jgi:hypothetical protein
VRHVREIFGNLVSTVWSFRASAFEGKQAHFAPQGPITGNQCCRIEAPLLERQTKVFCRSFGHPVSVFQVLWATICTCAHGFAR